MKTHPATDDLLRALLERRATAARPGGLLKEIVRVAAETPQRRSRQFTIGWFTGSPLMAAGGAAAIVVVIAGTLVVAPRLAGPGETPSPAATASTAASESPTSSRTPGPSPTSGAAHLGQWVAAAPMATARMRHAATLLADGRVLVTGGTDTWLERRALSSAEIYDPETGQWTPTGSMAATRVDHAAVLLPDGRVLVMGGAATNKNVGVEAWDPATGEWSALGHWTETFLADTSIVLPDGRVFVARNLSSGVQLFDPLAGTWSEGGSIAVPRVGPGFVLLENGTVLAVGGEYYSRGFYLGMTTIEAFDPAAEAWRSVGDLPDGFRVSGGVALEDGRLLVVNRQPRNAVTFDPVSGAIDGVPGPVPIWAESSSIRLDNRFVLFAGRLGTGILDPALGSWLGMEPMAQPRDGATFTLLRSGDVLLVGGDPNGGEPTTAVDRYQVP